MGILDESRVKQLKARSVDLSEVVVRDFEVSVNVCESGWVRIRSVVRVRAILVGYILIRGSISEPRNIGGVPGSGVPTDDPQYFLHTKRVFYYLG